jgi:hypothetical protein
LIVPGDGLAARIEECVICADILAVIVHPIVLAVAIDIVELARTAIADDRTVVKDCNDVLIN